MKEFENLSADLRSLIVAWEPQLLSLSSDIIANRKNSQGRNIRQIVGHMVDSASNNTHRVVHLQYQKSPLVFPDYANLGNNDRWIAVQNYQEEEWHDLVKLWKYSNLHFAHIINNIEEEKANNIWLSALNQEISLKAMVIDFPRHFKLHLREIEELLSH